MQLGVNYVKHKFQDCTCYHNWDSIVIIVTTVQTGRFGVWSLAGKR